MEKNTLRTRHTPSLPVPLPEYPRPQLARPDWINLNGEWEYAITPRTEGAPREYDGRILVPFPVESLLSGVQKPLQPDQYLWYRRTFDDPRPGILKGSTGGRILLHFGAVDYEAVVWINGAEAGSHRGGYLPFTFDITPFLKPDNNEIVVRVWDPTDSGMQQRGKQVLKPRGIWYTAVSGIWQTVWMEAVPQISIEKLTLVPDLAAETLFVGIGLRGTALPDRLRIEICDDAGNRLELPVTGSSVKASLPVSHPRAWCPEDPHLYNLTLRLFAADELVDEIASYYAMRSVSIAMDSKGMPRIYLNGKPVFMFGPLDQGYFPDGLYTPPSEEAMLSDIEYTRNIGCNMIRKHIKVEPLRWYYHCDRLGMLVWQDMPNGGLIDGMPVALAAQVFGFHRDDTSRLGRFGRSDAANRVEFKSDLKEMVDHLQSSPCIVVWVPFNESWGQFQANETASWLKAYDPTRLVDHASGWFDQYGGDFQSLHVYFKKLSPPTPDGRAFILSEFGGYSLKLPGHLWDPDRKFGYRFFNSREALTSAYTTLLTRDLKPLIPQGLAGAVYTQTTDVEIEINGYLTYDRLQEKMDPELLRSLHRDLIDYGSAG